MSRESIDLQKVQDDGEELLKRFGAVLDEKFGEDALAKEDLAVFRHEVGALGYAINNLQATIASLLIERFISQGEDFEETIELVRQLMMADADAMALEGARRLESAIAIAALRKKKVTSH